MSEMTEGVQELELMEAKIKALVFGPEWRSRDSRLIVAALMSVTAEILMMSKKTKAEMLVEAKIKAVLFDPELPGNLGVNTVVTALMSVAAEITIWRRELISCAPRTTSALRS